MTKANPSLQMALIAAGESRVKRTRAKSIPRAKGNAPARTESKPVESTHVDLPPARPDPLPDARGMYRAHVIHHTLGIEFDIELPSKVEGNVLYHGATFHVPAKKESING